MDRSSEFLKDMYEKFPFPSSNRAQNLYPRYLPDFVRRILDRGGHMRVVGDVATRLLGDGKDRRILDAGCGTGEIAVDIARRLPQAEVVAEDITERSLEKAKELAEFHKVNNVTFRQRNLMNPLPEGESYDLAISIGVIHHLDAPEQGLRNMKAALRPEGRMLLYLYGKLGRHDLMLNREVLNLLVPDERNFEDKIRLIEALNLYPDRKRSPLKESVYRLLGFDRKQTRQAWMVDQLANLRDRDYELSELEDLLAKGEVAIERFEWGFPNSPEEFTDSELVREHLRQLDAATQRRIYELLIRPFGFLFLAVPAMEQ